MSNLPKLIIDFCTKQGYITPIINKPAISPSTIAYSNILSNISILQTSTINNNIPSSVTILNECIPIIFNIRLGCILDGVSTQSQLASIQKILSSQLLLSSSSLYLFIQFDTTIYFINKHLFLQRYYALKKCITILSEMVHDSKDISASSSSSSLSSILSTILFIFHSYSSIPLVPILCGKHFNYPIYLLPFYNNKHGIINSFIQWMKYLIHDLEPIYQSIITNNYTYNASSKASNNNNNLSTPEEEEWISNTKRKHKKTTTLPSIASNSSSAPNIPSSEFIPIFYLSLTTLLSCPVTLSGFLLDFPYVYDTQYPLSKNNHHHNNIPIPSILSNRLLHHTVDSIGTNCLANINLYLYKINLQSQAYQLNKIKNFSSSSSPNNKIKNLSKNISLDNYQSNSSNVDTISFSFSVPEYKEIINNNTIPQLNFNNHDRIITLINYNIIKQYKNILNQRINRINNQLNIEMENTMVINKNTDTFTINIISSIENRPAILL